MRLSLYFFLLTSTSSLLAAQSPAEALRERSEYVAWLETAPNSPMAAVAHQRIGQGLRLGPAGADIPLEKTAEYRMIERGAVVRLEGPDGTRTVPRGVQVRLGENTLTVDGAPGRGVLTVFAPKHSSNTPEHFPYDPALVFVGPLARPERPGTVRVLAADGIEVEAHEAGTVALSIAGSRSRLRVLRIPTGAGEESELEIYFQDRTNGTSTYPAGRFVSLIPEGTGRYRLDFNRARNPFCAYSSAYPCPIPWRGNTVLSPVKAGERYVGGGLTVPSIGGAPK